MFDMSSYAVSGKFLNVAASKKYPIINTKENLTCMDDGPHRQCCLCWKMRFKGHQSLCGATKASETRGAQEIGILNF